MWMSVLFCSLFVIGGTLGETINKGCPTLSVEPCVCTNNPYPYLACHKVDEADILRKVFQNSATYRFKVVKITNSVLQFLPYDLFEKVEVNELHLLNVTLVQLFDETPENMESLQTLHMDSTYIFRGIIWEHLEPMIQLRILNIYNNRIEYLDSEFVQYAPKNLEQISFYETKTSKIMPGVFAHFPKLDKVAVDHCELKEIKRNIFPKPFYGRVLYFNNNHLMTIPADLFSDMPNLQTVGLRGNNIATLSATMFGAGYKKLDYFMIDGNPLRCDCGLSWLISKKPPVLKGVCFNPPNLHGRDLSELDPEMLTCK